MLRRLLLPLALLALAAGLLAGSAQRMAAAAVVDTGTEVALSSYPGADAADRLDAALDAWAAEPAGGRRTVVFGPNTLLDLSQRDRAPGQPYQLADGMRFRCLAAVGREFRTGCRVRVQGGPALWRLKPGSNVRTRDVSMVGFEWEGSAGTHFIEPVTDFAAGPILAYSDFADSGWFGFATVMQVRVLGVRLVRFYIQGSDHTPIRWAGSDSLIADGFVDSPYLDDSEYLLWMVHQSHTEIRRVFATCDGPTCLRVDGGYPTLRVVGGDYESQGAPRGAAGAAVVVNGGFVDLDGIASQNTNCDPTTKPADRGRVTVNGGVVRVLALAIGNRSAGCAARPADLADVQANGGKVWVYFGVRQDGSDILVRRASTAVQVRSDVPVAVGR
jgi:hypothetical protein